MGSRSLQPNRASANASAASDAGCKKEPETPSKLDAAKVEALATTAFATSPKAAMVQQKENSFTVLPLFPLLPGLPKIAPVKFLRRVSW